MKKKTAVSIGVIGIVAVVIVCIVVFILSLFRIEGQYVRVTDTKGLKKGHSVIWHDAYVGTVTGVKSKEGQFEIWFELNPEFKKTIRSDAKACLTIPRNSPSPVIMLVGGKDLSFPLFAEGAEVQEIPESELLSAQLSEKIAELKNYDLDEIIVWSIMSVIGVCVLAVLRKLKLKGKGIRNSGGGE